MARLQEGYSKATSVLILLLEPNSIRRLKRRFICELWNDYAELQRKNVFLCKDSEIHGYLQQKVKAYVCKSTDAMTAHVLENTVIFKSLNHLVSQLS